jgi:predicted PurR-regulated permease PerM
MPFRGRNSVHFVQEFKNITYSNVIGQGIVALAQGIFLSIGFIIFKIPDPVFWGMICFFVSFLPIIGSAAVFIPAGLIEIASGDNFSGFGILIYGFIAVANIDNLLRIWVNSWIGNIHPLITITGIVIGIPLFGILGLVFGPLLISFFLLLIRMYEAVYSDNNVEKERVVRKSELERKV